jgi:NitT/TauT family transport system substrate-binding protein
MQNAKVWIPLLLSFFTLLGCSPQPTPTDSPAVTKATPQGPRKVRLQLNWYPEAEHGCFYAAKSLGFYDEVGLDVVLEPGGHAQRVAQELATRRVNFGIANADDVVLAAEQDVSMVAIMSTMQDSPRCLLLRSESGITAFDQIKNVTLLLDSSQAYVAFLKGLGYLDSSVKIAPYFGNIAPLAGDINYGCQGYSFSEPLLAKEQGINVNVLSVRDAGFNPYCSLLVATKDTLTNDPEMVRLFVAASLKGLEAYCKDPKVANEAILKANPEQMTADALQYGADAIVELAKPKDEDVTLGSMTTARWQTLIEQCENLNLLTKGKLKPSDVFTTDFLPKSE